MSNVHEIKTAPNSIRSQLETLKHNLAALNEYQEILAEMRIKSFHAHRKAGFTEAQALELVKKLF